MSGSRENSVAEGPKVSSHNRFRYIHVLIAFVYTPLTTFQVRFQFQSYTNYLITTLDVRRKITVSWLCCIRLRVGIVNWLHLLSWLKENTRVSELNCVLRGILIRFTTAALFGGASPNFWQHCLSFGSSIVFIMDTYVCVLDGASLELSLQQQLSAEEKDIVQRLINFILMDNHLIWFLIPSCIRG